MGSQVAEGGIVGVDSHLFSNGKRIIIQKGRRANGCGGRLRMGKGGEGVG